MHVEHEPHVAEWLGTDARQRRDVERLEDGVDSDPIAFARNVPEIDGVTVGQHQVDLGVRDPEPFDDVLQRRVRRREMREGAGAPRRGKEVVQFRVEADFDSRHGGYVAGAAVERSPARPADRTADGRLRGAPAQVAAS